MSNKTYGLNYERKEKHFWQGLGFEVLRSRGSFGLFDLIAANPNFWTLISVKSTKQDYFSFKTEIEQIGNFKNAPPLTRKILVVYQKGKRKVLFDKIMTKTL